ncbi:MAG: SCO family protein [Chloroflexi bacterium]|nr:SCO family protein [Chloroflexota bacterium]
MRTLSKKKHPLVLAFLVMTLLLLPACTGKQKPYPAPPFELTDQSGQKVSLSQLRGKTVILTFAYTYCPTVCPLLIYKSQEAVSRLDDSARSKIALVVATVDPQRDTVERLRDYTAHLSHDWLYLTGEASQLRVMWENYGIYVEKQDKKTKWESEGHPEQHGYEVIHSAKVFLIDGDGFLRSELTGDWPVTKLVEQLTLLQRGEEIPRDFQPWQSFVDFTVRCGPVSFASLSGATAHFVFMAIPPAIVVAYLVLWRRRRSTTA